ncbi:MAG: cytochrome c [Halofilum sp. (in: g-proteobacteria)]|nr:cytochrome c [Halofilum sp. (in: g-proteobacteria)]
MRYHIASAGLAAVIVMGFGGGTAHAEIDGADMYEVRCATCHGANGEGTKGRIPALGPPLRGNQFVVNAPENVLRDVIRNGRQGMDRNYDDEYPNMPAFDYTMVDDMEALIEFLKGDLQN